MLCFMALLHGLDYNVKAHHLESSAGSLNDYP